MEANFGLGLFRGLSRPLKPAYAPSWSAIVINSKEGQPPGLTIGLEKSFEIAWTGRYDILVDPVDTVVPR